MRTKKVKASGKLRAGYGKSVREKYRDVEIKQRKAQSCPFCKKTVQRKSTGIWECRNCGKRFASHAYYLKK